MLRRTFDRAAGVTTDAGTTWTFPGVLENNVFRSDPVTKSDELGNFFFLSLQSNVQQSFFCDDLWSSVNGGQSWTLQPDEQGAGGGDKQWFTIDKTNGPGHGFQYQLDDGINCNGGGGNFNVLPMAASPGRAQLTFPTDRYTGRWTWTRTAMSFSVEKETPFIAFAPATPRSEAKRPLLTRVTAVNLGGDSAAVDQWSGTYRHVIPGNRSLRCGHQQQYLYARQCSSPA